MPQNIAGYTGPIAAVRTGVGGLSVSLNPSAIRLKNVIVAEGAIFRHDSWRKEPGTALFGFNTQSVTANDSRVVALTDWHPLETIQRIVHLRGDGKLYFTIQNPGTTGDPGAFVDATNAAAGCRFGYFVTGGSESGDVVLGKRKLFLFRKDKLPAYVDGDVTVQTPISGFPGPGHNTRAADWSDAHPPIVGIINGGGNPASSGGGRLFAAGNSNNPHALYASKAGDQTDFTTVAGFISDTQVLSIFPGVGERIYGLRNYQGFIVVFKYPRGIFLQDARDVDPANWLTQQVTDAIGIAPTPYAAVQLENDVLFLGSDGNFYLLSAVIAAAAGQQNMQTANIAMDLEIYQFLLNAYDRGLFSQVQSVYQPFWQTATFTLAGPSSPFTYDGSHVNNTRFMFDFTAVGRKGGEPRFSYSYRDQASALALWRDPSDFIDKPIYGDYAFTGASAIIRLEQDSRTTWNGTAYPFRVQTPHTNLGEFENLVEDKFVQFANRNKIFDNLEVEYQPLTPAIVTVRIFIDGRLHQTISIPLVFGGAPLDMFILDVDTLGTGQVRSVVHRLNGGAGRRISLAFEHTTYGQDVAITHFFLGFRPGDTTQSPRA